MFNERILNNNLSVIYEKRQQAASVAFGVWIGAGSRYESSHINGISHFIEHMVFKGTRRRNARQIACEFDRIGGQANAFTGRDCTCFYTKTLSEDLETVADIFSDMLLNSAFDPEQIDTEREVILEEINMYEDDPEELIHDLLTGYVWKDWQLGSPILGSKKSVSAITRDSILEFMESFYVPDNCVITVVGNFDESWLITILDKYFGSWKPKNYCPHSLNLPSFSPGFLYRKKEIEQTHICLGFECLSMADHRNCSLLVLNNIIAGCMSSRLCQNIREERGLAYTIYSFPVSFRDTGMFSIYAATRPDRVGKVMELITDELLKICENGVTCEELNSAKKQLKSNYLLGLDSVTDRMISLGKYKLICGSVRSSQQILDSIESVNSEKVLDLMHQVICRDKAALAVLGPSAIPDSVSGLFNI